jgi:uncharacterized protein DUF4384
MRLKLFVSLLTIALIASFAVSAGAQQDPNDEEGVRGSFLTSRPPISAGVGVTSSASGSSKNKSTGNTVSKNSGRNTGRRSKKGTTANTGKGTTTVVGVKNYSTGPIGLGYTLYMRNQLGDAVRIDPSREFRAGDRIRLSMEANTDGYLYVFHTENDQAPTLIFPDARLNDGDNSIEAHVPYEVPSPFEASENLRWFAFDERPAIERLYIVITREPLPGTPIGADLVNFCRTDQSRCPLRMLPSAWTRVKAALNSRVRVSKSRTYGQTQTSGEREATTRGLGLDQSAPEPSVVRMSVSTTDSILVTAIDLIHR